MKRWIPLYLCSVLPIVLLAACQSSRSIGGWCSISSKIETQSDDETVIYALVFEELKGVLLARIVDCGGKEFYLGYSSSSKSSNVIPAGYRQSDMRWDGKLSCNDAQSAYPQDSSQAKSLLKGICEDMEALGEAGLG